MRRLQFFADRVVVTVALRRRRLRCPLCEFSTPHRARPRPVESAWRHLDLGVWRLEIRARLRRLRVPRARGAGRGRAVRPPPGRVHARLRGLVAWLATRTDKTAITRLLRIDWDTVGRIIARVCADELDRDRLENLFEIGIDEVRWKRQHNYLTLVADHLRGQIVWGPGPTSRPPTGSSPSSTPAPHAAPRQRPTRRARRSRPALTMPGEPEPPVAKRARTLEVISLDMGPGYAKSAREHAPQAIIAIDPYHVVALANRALDEVRRAYWNELRQLGDPDAAQRFKDARWSLLKSPQNLTDKQAATLRRLKAAGGEVWRAYTLKEALRGDLRARPHARGRRRS